MKKCIKVTMHLCWKYTFGALCSSQVVRRGRWWATEASCARRTPNTELVTCGRHPPLLSLCKPAILYISCWFFVSNHTMSHQVTSYHTGRDKTSILRKKAKSTKVGCAIVNPLLFCSLWPSSPHKFKVTELSPTLVVNVFVVLISKPLWLKTGYLHRWCVAYNDGLA